jgi:hypothetical protein
MISTNQNNARQDQHVIEAAISTALGPIAGIKDSTVPAKVTTEAKLVAIAIFSVNKSGRCPSLVLLRPSL